MKRYAVVFQESAQADVRGSYDWGCRVWGKKEARRWVRELRSAVSKQLSLVPKGFPIAPEDDEFLEEIRQMIVGRYRVLFTIRRHKVHVLHLEALMFGERRILDLCSKKPKRQPRAALGLPFWFTNPAGSRNRFKLVQSEYFNSPPG